MLKLDSFNIKILVWKQKNCKNKINKMYKIKNKSKLKSQIANSKVKNKNLFSLIFVS